MSTGGNEADSGGRVGLVYHDDFLLHDTGPGFPERPARLPAIRDRLIAEGLWDALVPIAFGEASDAELVGLHRPTYISRLKAACAAGRPYIDTQDCPIVPATERVARLAVGGALAAADAIARASGRPAAASTSTSASTSASEEAALRHAVVLARPPGHHAEADRAMGFCYYGTAALAADRLIQRGFERVALIDFDVHHGNGTQHLLEDRSDILFVSSHQHPDTLYPGTGYAHERGRGAGAGFTLNVPLDPLTDDAAMREAYERQILPAVAAFDPQAIVLSAGFDAAASDQIAQLNWTNAAYEWLAEVLITDLDRPTLMVLEGGYDLDALASGVSAMVRRLLASVTADGD